MEDTDKSREETLDGFRKALQEQFVAVFGYVVGVESTVAPFREARRKVEACWIEVEAAFAGHPHWEDMVKDTANVRVRVGDDLFYDKGAAVEAIAEYEAALALDPWCTEALKGIIAACLQGEECRAEQALPYALRLVELEPGRAADVEYIRSLIKAQTTST